MENQIEVSTSLQFVAGSQDGPDVYLIFCMARPMAHMTAVQNLSAEELASLFHHYRELLATDFGFQSSEGCCSWDEVLPRHRQLMLATARLVLRDLAARQHGNALLD